MKKGEITLSDTVNNLHSQRVLILDFGSQYAQLIARRVREIGVYCELHAHDISKEKIQALAPKAIILSGGPDTSMAVDALKPAAEIFELGLPILGICYGMQIMVECLGGHVSQSTIHEFGHAHIAVKSSSKFFKNIMHFSDEGWANFDVWMSHGDKVIALPSGFSAAASTSTCSIAAIEHHDRRLYGVQFHPEVTHTQHGVRILEHFIVDIAGCECLWKSRYIAQTLIEQAQCKVGSRKVLLALSGGVDSSVVAALLHKAIGDQLICVFVDTGLLRLNEATRVMQMFDQHLGARVIHIDAKQRFLNLLKGIVDPEEKRKRIGEMFIDIFEEEAKTLKDIAFLAQGTIYPDVIESAASITGKAHVIKSHHNVGGLPERMQLSLLEPLRELFKDEVRKIGLEIGLPHDMVYRHPFPGPGLGVRILGEVRESYVEILRKADAIFIDELVQENLYHTVSQAFAVFLPVKSVGVVGDQRRYSYVITLRAVETIDFMTARWAHLSYAFLDQVSRRIINEICEVSRVTYDISGKPPSTIEWE